MKVKFQKHSSLIEGVFNGFTFSLLDEDNITMHTPAQCKDYLQDLWWSENTKKPTAVHGFVWKPGSIKLGQRFYRFALRDDRSKTLLDREAGMRGFLNYFESTLGFELSTMTRTEDDNVLVVNASGGWFQNPPLISSFSTITRLGMLYEGGDGIEYLDSIRSKFPKDKGYYGKAPDGFFGAMMADMGRINTIYPRLKLLASGKFPDAKWSDFSDGYAAHEGGIINYTKWGC